MLATYLGLRIQNKSGLESSGFLGFWGLGFRVPEIELKQGTIHLHDEARAFFAPTALHFGELLLHVCFLRLPNTGRGLHVIKVWGLACLEE